MATALEHDSVAYGTERDEWQEETARCKSGVCLTVIVFGATGDLAAKKTFKSLATLYNKGFMPDTFSMIGFGRSDYNDQQLRDKIRDRLPGSDKEKDKFLEHLTYQRGGGYDKPEGFQTMQQEIAKREGACDCETAGRLFYLAVPPSAYASIIANVKEHTSDLMIKGTEDHKSWVRVVIEKPFGKDLQTSKELSEDIAQYFTEEAVYRIDHYLGKELSQNLLVMRFSNHFMSAIWDNKMIDNIQITMKEDFGTEGRGGYYDSYGVIRDVVQNHLLQILALLCMERPVTMHPDDIRDEKTKLIRSLRTVQDEDIVVAQYTAANGKPGYTDDDGVPNDSLTPTYCAVRLWCDNERWEGVPMVIKAGKAMNESKTEVRLQFKSQAGFFGEHAEGFRNEFIIQLKPTNSMYMKMNIKKPGLEMDAITAELNLSYDDRFDDWVPEAYERLILDAMNGNQQHFVRRDELRASWAIFTPMLHKLDAGKGPKLQKYDYGARGVDAGDQLLADSGYVRSAKYSWKSHAQEEREAKSRL